MKKVLLRVLEWIGTLLYFMVWTPIIWVLQAICTPFEMVAQFIINKRFIDPREYFYKFGCNMVYTYTHWVEVFGEENEDKAE